MSSGSTLRVVVVAAIVLAAAGPALAQNPWTSDGGYYEQYDMPAGKFKTQTLRWIWTNHAAPDVGGDFVAYFHCWRIDDNGGVGSNKFVIKWTLTGMDSGDKVKLPKWAMKLDEGFIDDQSRVVNQIAPLAAESMVLVEAQLKVKRTIGAGEYVGCAMDLSHHPDGFLGF